MLCFEKIYQQGTQGGCTRGQRQKPLAKEHPQTRMDDILDPLTMQEPPQTLRLCTEFSGHL